MNNLPVAYANLVADILNGKIPDDGLLELEQTIAVRRHILVRATAPQATHMKQPAPRDRAIGWAIMPERFAAVRGLRF